MSHLQHRPWQGILAVVLIAVSGAPALAGVSTETEVVTAASNAGTPVGAHGEITSEGIAIQFEMERLTPRGASAPAFEEGDLARFRFRVKDATTQTPLSGVYPAAWMDRRPEGENRDQKMCREKVSAFVGGSLLSPPELDLNVYYVLAMNDDASISVVDPLFGFGTTKLLDMIFLPAPGEDWLLTDDQMTLFVSIPDTDQVSIADTATWTVAASITVGSHPSRLALQRDGRYLWVGYDDPPAGEEMSGVSVIDTEKRALVKSVPTGRGHHEIAISSDDRFVFVTNQTDGTLSIIDVRSLSVVEQKEVGRQPVSIVYSPVAQAAYVASAGDGTVAVVDGREHALLATIKAAPGLGAISLAPGGRLAFLVNPQTDRLHILDVSVNRIIQTGEMEDGPDQVAFSENLAYVRHRDSEIILMIPLDEVGREGARIPTVDFPGGQRPFGRVSHPSRAAAIVEAPGATAVLVANAADRTIYYYKEGMAAPMGHFQNYSREPRAVLAVDRSLSEHAPGSYETVAQLRRPGLYDVAFFLDSPRTVHCFPVDVAPNPDLVAERLREHPLRVEPESPHLSVETGKPVTVRFRVVDAASGAPRSDLGDVDILTFLAPGIGRKEQRARLLGEGVYGATFLPGRAGVYYAFAQVPSAHLPYKASPFVLMRARDAMAGADERVDAVASPAASKENDDS
ncbi:MAG: YncE family protein [Acidobacteriota bacterium]